MQKLFHYTGIDSLLRIMESRRIRMTSVERVSGTERQHGNASFFLSLTRSKIGGYHTRIFGNYGVLLEIDGDFLRNNNKIRPVDYWGPEFRKTQANMNEMEERLFSNKQFLDLPSPITKMIEAVHILVQKEKSTPDPRTNVTLRRALLECKKRNVPVFVYTEPKYWTAMRPQYATKLSELTDYLKGKEEYPYQRLYRNYLEPYYELYMKPKGSKLSKEADDLRYNLKYYSRDGTSRFLNELHNSQKSEYMSKLAPLIRKHGGPEGYIQFLIGKYSN